MLFEIGFNWQTILAIVLLVLALGKVLGFGKDMLRGWRGIGRFIKLVTFIFVIWPVCLVFWIPKQEWPKFKVSNGS